MTRGFFFRRPVAGSRPAALLSLAALPMTTASSPSPSPTLAGFHRTAERLLAECPRPDALAWLDAHDDSRPLSARALRDALQCQAGPGIRYARELLEEALDGLMRQAGSTFRDVARRLSAAGEDALVEQALLQGMRPLLVALYRALPEEAVAWRYMSKTYGAREFAQALETGDTDVLRTVSDVLRVCRDLLAARARLHNERSPVLPT